MSNPKSRLVLPVEERRSQILAAAAQVFAEKGFSGTRIADIAAEAKIAQGLVYRYFSSKEALFAALVEESFERLAGAIEGLRALPLNGGAKIMRGLGGLVQRLGTDAAFARRLVLMAQAGASRDVPAEAAVLIATHRMKPYEAIAGIIAEGQADGSVRTGDPLEMAVLFWTLVKGLAMHGLGFGEGAVVPDIALLSRFFLNEGGHNGPSVHGL